jgi:ERCC4-type nuclease
MIIIIDTREQLPLTFTGHETINRKLDEGDYNTPELEDKIVIERKSLQDFYQSITINHQRFKAEILRAKEKNKPFYIFIEGTLEEFYHALRIEDIYYYNWSPIAIKTKPETLRKIVNTMIERHKIIIIECEDRKEMEVQIIALLEIGKEIKKIYGAEKNGNEQDRTNRQQ